MRFVGSRQLLAVSYRGNNPEILRRLTEGKNKKLVRRHNKKTNTMMSFCVVDIGSIAEGKKTIEGTAVVFDFDGIFSERTLILRFAGNFLIKISVEVTFKRLPNGPRGLWGGMCGRAMGNDIFWGDVRLPRKDI